MKHFVFMSFCIVFVLVGKAQDYIGNDSLDDQNIYKEILLDELFITNEKLSEEEIEARKQFLILRNRVYRTYPYARTASDKLNFLNQSLSKLNSKREKKKFLKITQQYIENEFEERLKKLSRKDGQILVKLIQRQTGQTTYNLVKDLKSGWKAYWYGKVAKFYNIDLKSEYKPFFVEEDFWIETILCQAFKEKKLIEQSPKQSIDYDQLKEKWNKNRLHKIKY